MKNSKHLKLVKRCYKTPVPLQITHKKFLDIVKHHGRDSSRIESKFIGKELIHITISNPLKRNAITGSMMMDLASIVDDLTVNQDSKGAIGILVTGDSQGKTFCSGADFSLVKTLLNDSKMGGLMSNFMTETLNRLRSSGYISVCIVNGPAVGGGAELSTFSDFRLMSKTSSFLQFVHADIGASPGWGGARRLTQIVGRKNAIKYFCTASQIDSTEAFRSGLVDEITEDIPDKALEHGIQFMQPYVIKKFPKSLLAIKTAIGAIEAHDIADSLKIEQEMFQSRWFPSDNSSALEKK